MKLSSVLFTFMFSVACFYSANAQQGLKVGVLGGANYSSYKYSGNKGIEADYDPGFGYYAGGFISIPMGVQLTFVPELLYSYQTATAHGDIAGVLDALDISENELPIPISGDIKLNAKETLVLLPLMLRMKLKKFDVGIGPQVGYSLSRELKVEGFNDLDVYDYFDEKEEDKFALNLNFDAGFYITDNLKINARYSYGLLLRDEVRTSIWQLGLSYRFL